MGKNLLIAFLALGWGTTLWFHLSRDREQPKESPISLTAPLPSATSAPEPSVVTPPDPIPAADPLLALLSRFNEDPSFQAAHIGFCLLGNSAEPLVAKNADRALTPASTLKTITTATALEILGPDFRMETTLAATGEISAGTLAGDLIIVGGGDPTLTSETLVAWAEKCAARGLKKVRRVVADERHFPETLAVDAWDWGDVSNYYGAGPSGLNLDENRFLATFTPGKELHAPAILQGVTPALPWLKFDNFMLTGPAGSGDLTSVYGGPYAERLAFRGTVPADATEFPCRGAIPDPPYHAAYVFHQALKAKGIVIASPPTTMRRLSLAKEPPPKPVAVWEKHASPPLLDLVTHLHRVSDNLYTETIFLSLAKKANKPADQVIREHWAPRGVGFHGLRMEDGSGLARADLITPLDMASVLARAREGPHGAAFHDSLLPAFDEKVRWKGGSMSRVRSWSGYIHAASGSEYAFALIFNGHTVPDDAIEAVRDQVIQAVLQR